MGTGQNDRTQLAIVSVTTEFELIHAPQRGPTVWEGGMDGSKRHGVVEKLQALGFAAPATDFQGKLTGGEAVTPEPDHGTDDEQCNKGRAHNQRAADETYTL